MTIKAYTQPDKYLAYQQCRPDYPKAIEMALSLAKNHVIGKQKVSLADFCCGVGSNTDSLAKELGGITKATLIDKNPGFLGKARKAGIQAKELDFRCQNILDVNLEQEYDLVLSIFAYHHIPDRSKHIFVQKVCDGLKSNGALILAEIYLPTKQDCLTYYRELFKAIPKERTIPGLKEFLDQTARSDDEEFKVSKSFAEKQFADCGFVKTAEHKIWPLDERMDKDLGTFVQIYNKS